MAVWGVFLKTFVFLSVSFWQAFFSGSIAVAADAFNNLSDAGSLPEFLPLWVLRLAGPKPDSDHALSDMGGLNLCSGSLWSP